MWIGKKRERDGKERPTGQTTTLGMRAVNFLGFTLGRLRAVVLYFCIFFDLNHPLAPPNRKMAPGATPTSPTNCLADGHTIPPKSHPPTQRGGNGRRVTTSARRFSSVQWTRSFWKQKKKNDHKNQKTMGFCFQRLTRQHAVGRQTIFTTGFSTQSDMSSLVSKPIDGYSNSI